MKRLICAALAIALAVSAAGCSSSEKAAAKPKDSNKSVKDILSKNEQVTTVENQTLAPMDTDPVTSYPDLDFTAEYDLTKMSATVVYSAVSNMMTEPEKYIGKSVKANGTFDVYVDPDTETYYYSCIIKDATACCANGLEFLPKENLKYPDDFPKTGAAVTIGGTFETYNEGDKKYCRLRDAEVSFG